MGSFHRGVQTLSGGWSGLGHGWAGPPSLLALPLPSLQIPGENGDAADTAAVEEAVTPVETEEVAAGAGGTAGDGKEGCLTASGSSKVGFLLLHFHLGEGLPGTSYPGCCSGDPGKENRGSRFIIPLDFPSLSLFWQELCGGGKPGRKPKVWTSTLSKGVSAFSSLP